MCQKKYLFPLYDGIFIYGVYQDQQIKLYTKFGRTKSAVLDLAYTLLTEEHKNLIKKSKTWFLLMSPKFKNIVRVDRDILMPLLCTDDSLCIIGSISSDMEITKESWFVYAEGLNKINNRDLLYAAFLSYEKLKHIYPLLNHKKQLLLNQIIQFKNQFIEECQTQVSQYLKYKDYMTRRELYWNLKDCVNPIVLRFLIKGYWDFKHPVIYNLFKSFKNQDLSL